MKNIFDKKGISNSNGVNCSDGVNYSDGINISYGVNWSNGVNCSNGVNISYGVLECYGVDMALFPPKKDRQPTIFGVNVTKDEYENVIRNLFNKLNGWHPKFNNAFDLFLQNGSQWEKVDASKIRSTTTRDNPYEAWKDMPKEAIEYLQSLPQFDAENFKRVTGIDVEKKETINVST